MTCNMFGYTYDVGSLKNSLLAERPKLELDAESIR